MNVSAAVRWRCAVVLTVVGTVVPAAAQELAVTTVRGEFVRVSVTPGADVAVTVLTPAGASVARLARVEASDRPAEIAWVAESAGVYRVRAQAAPIASTGPERRFEVLERRPSAERDHDLVQAAAARQAGDDARRAGTAASAQQALRHYDEALARSRAAGDAYGEADARLGLGLVRWSLAEYETALADYQAAADGFKASGDRASEAFALQRLALTHRVRGDFARARRLHEDVIALAKATGSQRAHADGLNGLGRVNYETADMQAALDAFGQALAIARSIHDRAIEAYAVNNTGVVYWAMGEHATALEFFEQGLAVRRALADRQGEVASLHNMGMVLLDLGRLARSALMHERALAISTQLGNRRLQGSVLQELGRTRLRQGQPAVAADLLARSIALCRDVADRFCEAGSLSQLAAAEVALGRRPAARQHLDAALAMAREQRDSVEEAASLVSRGRLAGDAGDLFAAQADVQAALRIIESQRANVVSPELRTSYLASTRTAYETAIDLLMRRHAESPSAGHAARALAVSERARARSLLDSLSAARLTQPQLLELADIQASLGPSDAVLEFALGDQRSYLWVITASGLRAHTLAGRSVLEAAAIRAHEAVQQSHRPGMRMQARRALAAVGQLLFADAARDLSAERLIVVADGALQFVPFAAVPVREDGEPLLVRHEIVTLPSASAVATLRAPVPDRRTPDRMLALLADPVFDPGDARASGRTGVASRRHQPSPDLVRSMSDTATRLERLEYTGQEARRIASLVSPSQALVALGLDATREQAMSSDLARYRFVHFATHALVNTRRPDLSGIVLSTVGRDGAARDGFLRLPDIYAMQLSADVVVLSACQTALGRDIRGEGMVGLTRGFLHAGARSVVSTLWEVRDRQTSELMARFYEAMLRDGLAPGAALRKAQLASMRDPASSAPFYWAAFGMHGDWR